MDPSAQSFKSCCWRKGKGVGNLTPPLPGSRATIAVDGDPTLSPIFMPRGPPTHKHQRGSTITNQSYIDEQYLDNDDSPSLYWLNLFQLKNREQDKLWGGPPEPTTRETCVMMEHFNQMHRDYRMTINALVDDIETLKEELAEMRTTSLRPDTPTPIPFPPTTTSAKKIL